MITNNSCSYAKFHDKQNSNLGRLKYISQLEVYKFRHSSIHDFRLPIQTFSMFD